MQHQIAVKSPKCISCGFCEYYVPCHGNEYPCNGCGACLAGCPQQARSLKADPHPRPEVKVFLNGSPVLVPEGVTIEKALEYLGSDQYPCLQKSSEICGTGGCFNCLVLVKDRPVRSCVTPIRAGMKIVTEEKLIMQAEPLRLVSLLPIFPQHEISIFTHGCNYRCPTCHNWNLTFSSSANPLTPGLVVQRLAGYPQEHVGISGGEPTLNRKWLIEMVHRLKKLSSGLKIQVDTNASLLDSDYLDELVEAGMTDFSPDLKAFKEETFRKITGLTDTSKAATYLKNSWKSVAYCAKTYGPKIFMVVGIPYHPEFISLEELAEMGSKLAGIDTGINVSLIEYHAAFRQRELSPVDPEKIHAVRETLLDSGLRKVHIQASSAVAEPLDPEDLVLSSENF